MMLNKIDLSYITRRLDHTLLKINVDSKLIRKFAEEGVYYKVRGLVTTPSNIPLIAPYVTKYETKKIAVIAFPFGQTCLETKIREIDCALDLGAEELDIVLNTSLIKLRKIKKFRNEGEAISKYMKQNYPDISFKYIVEITVLDKEETIKAVNIVNLIEPHFFKTSTGYGQRGTEPNDVLLIKKYLNKEIGLKASGGIRTIEQFINLVEAGADVIGSSRGIEIIRQAIEKGMLL